jgi:hypothetical protein
VKNSPRHARHRQAARSPRVTPFPAPPPATACTAADAFAALWATLTEVIGPTATAALVQRSVKRAAADAADLGDLVIARDQFVYTYTLPESWKKTAAAATAALQHVIRQLWPLLSELTGPVVVQRLRQDPVLQRCGIIPDGGVR